MPCKYDTHARKRSCRCFLWLINCLLWVTACSESNSESPNQPLQDRGTMLDAMSVDAGMISHLDMMTQRLDALPSVDAGIIQDSHMNEDMTPAPDIGWDAGRLPALDMMQADSSVDIPNDVAPPPPRTREARIADFLRANGLENMRTRFPEAEIEEQEAMYPSAIDFETALASALESFLNDGQDLESPRSLAQDVVDGPCLMNELTERVRCFLNRDTAYLELYGREGFAPENREPINENWIFVLRAESLSDHIQWAIVDRSGVRDTYNYGFN